MPLILLIIFVFILFFSFVFTTRSFLLYGSDLNQFLLRVFSFLSLLQFLIILLLFFFFAVYCFCVEMIIILWTSKCFYWFKLQEKETIELSVLFRIHFICTHVGGFHFCFYQINPICVLALLRMPNVRFSMLNLAHLPFIKILLSSLYWHRKKSDQ